MKHIKMNPRIPIGKAGEIKKHNIMILIINKQTLVSFLTRVIPTY